MKKKESYQRLNHTQSSILKEKYYVTHKLNYFFRAFLFLLCIQSGQSVFAQNPTPVLITESILENDGFVLLSNSWVAKVGDDFNWLDESFDISTWETVGTKLNEEDLERLGWDGYGWFKTEIQVDSTLVGKPLLLLFNHHFGASQVYLNQDLIFRVGNFSLLKEEYQPLNDTDPRWIQFDSLGVYTITVRFSNHDAIKFLEANLVPGFELTIMDYDFYQEQKVTRVNKEKTRILLFLGILASLTIVHFLFLIFYPAGQKNFYFVLVAAGVTSFSLFYNLSLFSNNPLLLLKTQIIIHISWVIALIGLLRFAYSFQKNTAPLLLKILLVIGLIISFLSITNWIEINQLRYIFTTIVFIDVLRLHLVTKFKLKQQIDILLIGLAGFFAIVIFSQQNNFTFTVTDYPYFQNLLAITVLVFSVSAYLLRDFAKAQLKLEYKLLEVKHLSERSIGQERRSKEKEIEQKILEAENLRKTAELEEARALQISMLPTQLPDTEYWDIDAFMETSQEVGGDYYDFSISQTGELTVALGDATGHGMKAGIIVATAKSYFHTLANKSDNIEIIKKMSAGIKNMDIKMMYMGLMLLKCDKHSVKFTSGGMPPALLYRSSSKKVEQVLLKAMPLGSSIEFPYKELEYELNTGDIFLLLSDGLMELFNSKRELLGMDHITDQLLSSSGKQASEILSDIKELQAKWSGKAIQEDDVTVMVMKAK